MKKITLIIFIFINSLAIAQLSVNNTTINPTQLVQNILLGSSVTATNIKFNGSVANTTMIRNQAALFNTNFNATNLGLSSGFLLTTGKSQVSLGPNNHTSALKSLTTSTSNYFSELQSVTVTAIPA